MIGVLKSKDSVCRLLSNTSQLSLTVACTRPGKLQILGIEWMVCDILCGFHPLVLPKRLVLESKGRTLPTCSGHQKIVQGMLCTKYVWQEGD